MLGKNAFDLERSYSVAGGFYDIVGSADIPVVAVLIFPRGVAGMIESVVPRLGSLLLVAVIALEQTERNLGFGVNNDLAGDSGRYRSAVFVNDINIVVRNGLAH